MKDDTELSIAPYDHDDDLIAATLEHRRPQLRLYRLGHTMVVLGRGSRPAQELELSHCLEDRIPLLRRHGGGCAVLIDPGNVIVSVTLPLRGLGSNRRAFDRLSRWMIDGLAQVGFSGVYQEGASDLVLEGRKIGGACIYRRRDLLFYSTTLLVQPAIPLMQRYLRHPPREPDYRRGRAHADFVRSLADGLDPEATLQNLRRHLTLDALNL